MVHIRILQYLLICLTNIVVSVSSVALNNLSSSLAKLDRTTESVVKAMSSISEIEPDHNYRVKLFDSHGILNHDIGDLNKKMITLLNSLTDSVGPSSDDGVISIDFGNNYNSFGQFNGLEYEMDKIYICYARSIKLQLRSVKNDGSVPTKNFDDFIDSVLGRDFDIQESLTLNYLGLIDTKTSEFNKKMMNSLLKQYPENAIRRQQLHSIYDAIIRIEVQGFVTVAYAYWLCQLLGQGHFSTEIHDMKDLSMKRINSYSEAIRSIDFLNGCQRLKASLRYSTDHKNTHTLPQRVFSKKIQFYVKTAGIAVFTLLRDTNLFNHSCSVVLCNPDTFPGHSYLRIDENHYTRRYNWSTTPNILSEDEYRSFSISWTDNDINVDNENELGSSMNLFDDMSELNYFTVSTKYSPGEWIITGPRLDMGWCNTTNGDVPSSEISICRAYYRGHLLPGQLRPDNISCSVPFGVAVIVWNYEILRGSEPKWVSVKNRAAPPNVIIGGRDQASSDPYGICRAELRGHMLIGKLYINGFCGVADSRGEAAFENYEVIVGE